MLTQHLPVCSASRLAAILAMLTVSLSFVEPARAQITTLPGECGELTNAVGPFDAREMTDHMRNIEGYHFFLEIQRLEGTHFTIGDNLDYMLRAMPNHPGSLRTISRFSSLIGKEKVPGAKRTVDCYFARAMEFTPTDPAPHMIYGLHLLKLKKVEAAVVELKRAVELGSEDPNVDYNLGLAYVDLRQYDKAKEHAQRAYDRGYPLPGLRDKLTKAGQWP